MRQCESCQFYDYDPESQEDLCTAPLDEDDYARFLEQQNRDCPFFRFQDEYKTARKQYKEELLPRQQFLFF